VTPADDDGVILHCDFGLRSVVAGCDPHQSGWTATARSYGFRCRARARGGAGEWRR
jgi:hypothetical protein